MVFVHHPNSGNDSFGEFQSSTQQSSHSKMMVIEPIISSYNEFNQHHENVIYHPMGSFSLCQTCLIAIILVCDHFSTADINLTAAKSLAIVPEHNTRIPAQRSKGDIWRHRLVLSLGKIQSCLAKTRYENPPLLYHMNRTHLIYIYIHLYTSIYYIIMTYYFVWICLVRND